MGKKLFELTDGITIFYLLCDIVEIVVNMYSFLQQTKMEKNFCRSC